MVKLIHRTLKMALSTALLTLIGTMIVQADQPPCNDDEGEAKIYWTENANNVRNMRVSCKFIKKKKIRWNKTPADIENVVKGIGAGNNLRQIAVDAEHVFWTDMKNHRIMRASLKPDNKCPSADCSAIVEVKKINKPVGLAVEPSPDPDQEPGVDLDWIYWSDQSTREIWKARKDGSEQTPLLSYPKGIPTWLALAGDTLYFTDWLNKKIMKVNKNTPSPVADVAEVVVDANMVMTATKGYFDPFGIAVYENESESESESESEIYWANKAGGKIQKMSLKNKTITTLVNLKMSMNPLGLALDVDAEMVYWATSAGRKQAIRRAPMDCVDCDAKNPKMEDSVRAEWMSNAGHPAGLWVVGKKGDKVSCTVDTEPGGKLYWKENQYVKKGVIKGIEKEIENVENVIKSGAKTRQIALGKQFVYIAKSAVTPKTCNPSDGKSNIYRVKKKDTDVDQKDSVFVTGLCDFAGIAVHPTEPDRLYFTDQGNGDDIKASLWELKLGQYDGGIDLSAQPESLSYVPEDEDTCKVEDTNEDGDTKEDEDTKEDNTVKKYEIYEDETNKYCYKFLIVEENEEDEEKILVSVSTTTGSIIINKLMGKGTDHPKVGVSAFLALDHDKKKLYMASGQQGRIIQRVAITEDSVKPVKPAEQLHEDCCWLQGIAVDVYKDRVYWVNRTAGSIKSIAAASTAYPGQEEVVLLIDDAAQGGMGLALDLKEGKGWVYWVTGTPNYEIRRTFVCEDGQVSQDYVEKLDGETYETVHFGDAASSFAGIAVDN